MRTILTHEDACLGLNAVRGWAALDLMPLTSDPHHVLSSTRSSPPTCAHPPSPSRMFCCQFLDASDARACVRLMMLEAGTYDAATKTGGVSGTSINGKLPG